MRGDIPGQTTLELGFLSVKELAARIGRHPRTVYGWVYKRGLPFNRSCRHGGISIEWSVFKKWWSRDYNGED